MRRPAILTLIAGLSLAAAGAQQIEMPAQINAGEATSARTTGSGEATVLLFGPGASSSRKVKLGDDIQFSADDLAHAGRYVLILRSGGNDVTKTFAVVPGEAKKINFLARPSRVPVAQPEAISGTAFLFDNYDHLVVSPASVTFTLGVSGADMAKREVPA